MEGDSSESENSNTVTPDPSLFKGRLEIEGYSVLTKNLQLFQCQNRRRTTVLVPQVSSTLEGRFAESVRFHSQTLLTIIRR